MTTEYLFLAFVVLFLRTIFFAREEAIGISSIVALSIAQALALGLMRIDFALVAVAVAMAAVNACAFFLDRRGGVRSLARVAVTAALLIGLSFLVPAGSPLVRFADWTRAAAQAVGSSSALLAGLSSRSLDAALAILSGALLVSVDMNNLTRFILMKLRVGPGGGAARGSARLGRGKAIGIVERLLVFFFILTQNAAAVGFVVAAKGVARFRELENREFAEYVIIGTLLSVSSAILVGVLTGFVLRSL